MGNVGDSRAVLFRCPKSANPSAGLESITATGRGRGRGRGKRRALTLEIADPLLKEVLISQDHRYIDSHSFVRCLHSHPQPMHADHGAGRKQNELSGSLTAVVVCRWATMAGRYGCCPLLSITRSRRSDPSGSVSRLSRRRAFRVGAPFPHNHVLDHRSQD